jgi:adenylate cyclase
MPLRGSEPKLIVRLPGGASTEFAIRGERLSLGRNPQKNNICISDREVSKEHAEVVRRGSEIILKDLNSSNGTFVNDRQITEMRLKDGDSIRVGNTHLTFLAPADSAPPTQVVPAPQQTTQPGTTPGVRPNSGVVPIPLTNSIPSPSKPGLTVVHSFSAPVLAQVKQSADRNVKPVTAIGDVEQLRAEYERLRVAAEFQEKVRLDQGPDALLEEILNFAFSTLKADNGAILRKTDEGFEATHIKQRNANQSGFNVSDTLLEQVTTTRSAVLIQDVDFDPRFSAAQSIVSQGIKCAMGVPLVTNNRVRGVLYLDTLQRTHAFSDRDLHLLNGIANQAAIALENAELVAKVEKEAETRAHLARFLSPALVEQAQKGSLDLKRGGELTEITILFSDIRGFTSLSEKETAEDVVKMLNDYFELMVEVVFDTGGILDKFIGDALMALWGTPVKRPDDAERAVRAALEMQRRMIQFNRSRAQAGKAPIYIGIGINTGPVVVGNMGSSRRMEYTAIGDPVNLASRLCGVAKANEIIISSNTQALLRASLFDLDTSLPPARVKNKEKPIPVARVIDYASDRTAAT